MSIFPPRNFLMTLMTHDIRDISGRPYLGGQHGVSRIARGRFFARLTTSTHFSRKKHTGIPFAYPSHSVGTPFAYPGSLFGYAKGLGRSREGA